MRFLIVNTDYDGFMRGFYADRPGLAAASHAEQMRERFGTLFGMADFYSEALRDLGHEAEDLIVNLAPAQKAWAQENGVPFCTGWRLRMQPSRFGCAMPRLQPDDGWIQDILAAQVERCKPDVFYCMCIETLGTDFIRRIRPHIRLAVGQHAAPHSKLDISGYDLMLSSLPNYVDYYRRQGMRAEPFRLGFARRIAGRLQAGEKRHDVAFVGGLGSFHADSTALLEKICGRFQTRIWGYGVQTLPRRSVIRQCHGGPLWGLDMYQAYRDARIVFNRHIGIAENYANNLRLYEATGVGSLLLTDHKQNLPEIFQPGVEVAAYKNDGECLELIEHYLAHADEREKVAATGQRRTLTEHTYHNRMAELCGILAKYL